MSAGMAGLRRRVVALASGLTAALALQADPDEAWLVRASLPENLRPVLALIVDRSSATIEAAATDAPYDPARDYAAGLAVERRCDATRIYWRRGPGPAPDCAVQAGIELAPADTATGMHCERARSPMAQHGFFITARAAQWQPAAGGGRWTALQADRSGAVECRADRGQHGAMPGTWYAADGGTGPWTRMAVNEIAWDRSPLADPYIFYSGNFLNYLQSPGTSAPESLADRLARAAAAALDATDELDVALIRVDERPGAAGGYVMRAPVPSDRAAADLRRLALDPPGGGAPLAGTLAETAAWLAGDAGRYVRDDRTDVAATDAALPGHYRSPFTHACRPVVVALLTAGQPDDAGLPAIAERIAQADFRSDLPATQAAPVGWIAPSAVAPPFTGAPAHGWHWRAEDPLAYLNLVASAYQHDMAIAGRPQFSAAGLMLSDSAPGLVLGLSAPRARQRWFGNLFRYGLRGPDSPAAPPTITGRDDEPAIDAASGLPVTASRSLWSDAPDSNLLAGGAAGRLPAPDARRLYADLASQRILDPANRLVPANPRIDRALLGLSTADPETTGDVLAWLAAARPLGDPGLGAPLVVDYGSTQAPLVIALTHDGLLQAFDADSGVERWAWMPRELLQRLPQLMRDPPGTVRDHGIDGMPILHRHDADADGIIDRAAGEHLWLLFGLGRGGDRYYVLDLADPDDPQLLWSIELPASGQAESWAEPVVTRLAIAGSGQSSGNWVVLLSGGYDRRNDSPLPAAGAAGSSLQIVDAGTGRTLWRAGRDASADLPLAGLDASLPSAPRALDFDGDGLLDRAYLLDLDGGLWRLDFASGRGASELVWARLLARLGDGRQRFHATPDVSIARLAGRDQIAVTVGSGWRARPLDTSIVDRIYVILDRGEAATSATLSESDLHDASDGIAAMPATANGWQLRLDRHGSGEKVIGPAVTFDHVLRFQTYQPLPGSDESACGPPRAIQRRYAIDIRSGLPAASATDAGVEDERTASGLPAALRFGFPPRWNSHCADCRPRPFGVQGAATFDSGYAGDPVKTSWRKLSPPPASP